MEHLHWLTTTKQGLRLTKKTYGGSSSKKKIVQKKIVKEMISMSWIEQKKINALIKFRVMSQGREMTIQKSCQ